MRRPSLLALAWLAVAASGLAAQTTDTEREAAAQILRRIDSLETRLQPTRTAERLAARAHVHFAAASLAARAPVSFASSRRS